MQHTIQIILLVAAIVAFLFAAFEVPTKAQWVPLGYACVTGAFLVGLI